MSEYISTKDIFNNDIICTRSRWFGHITSNHEIMASNKTAVEDTISDPDTVYKSDGYDNRRVFFKDSAEATYYNKDLKTKVIVEYDFSLNKGEVVTAFPVKDEKGGISDVVYTRQNRL